MKTTFFTECRTLDERLAMLHHPDKGGDTATMQLINTEYEAIMKNPFFGFWKAREEAKTDFIQFPEIINQIIRFDINIEVCGNWIWLSGNTFACKDELKKIGFFFAPKKSMWYWRPRDFKSSNKDPKDMDYIRSKYGSDVVHSYSAKSLQGEEATA